MHMYTQVHSESSNTTLHQPTHSSHTVAMDTVQENAEPHAPLDTNIDISQIAPHVFPSHCTHIPPAPVILPNIPAGCPAPNNLDPTHFCYPPTAQMPYSPPPSWQMLLTQMSSLIQLQSIQRNMDTHKPHLSVYSQPCDAPMATPTDNQDHPSRVYPMMHHSSMPFMGYSGAGFESTFQSGCGQYKSDHVNTGISHFSHLSNPTTHHASCKDGYCHHIEAHLKKAKKQRKRKSSAHAKQKDSEHKV